MEQKETRTILVIGGTGTQGGYVARELLRHGHRVRILTRNPESEAAQTLAAEGSEVSRGDLADPASLGPAMHQVAAIFLCSTPIHTTRRSSRGTPPTWSRPPGTPESNKSSIPRSPAAIFSALG